VLRHSQGEDFEVPEVNFPLDFRKHLAEKYRPKPNKVPFHTHQSGCNQENRK
jgi:hypothetical protein